MKIYLMTNKVSQQHSEVSICVSHPDRQGQTLVPVWISVFLQGLGEDLKETEGWSQRGTVIWYVKQLQGSKALSEICTVQCHTHRFASKVDFYKRIHEIFPIAVKPQNLLHAIYEGIIHCREKRETCHLFAVANEQTVDTHSAADLQLWRSSMWTWLLSGKDQPASAGSLRCLPYPPHPRVYPPASNTHPASTSTWQRLIHCSTKTPQPHSPAARLQPPGRTGWPSGNLSLRQRGRQGRRAAATFSGSSVLQSEACGWALKA